LCARDLNAPPESQPAAKMKDRDRECLGRCADGIVRNDKVTNSVRDNAFAFAKLHFRNERISQHCAIKNKPRRLPAGVL